MSRTNKILLLLIAILVIVLAALVFWRGDFFSPSYFAVYLKTGDLYFGHLTRFPSFGLRQAYFFQVGGDQGTPLSIRKFTDVFWGPEDYLRINRNEVVWIAKLNSTSQLVQLIQSNPNLTVTPLPANTGAPQNNTSTPSSNR